MLYIPGLGYIPMASLGNIPGLNNLVGRGGPGGPQAAAPSPEGERPWRGLGEMPEVTRDTVSDLAGTLQDDDRRELTVLLLGKGGVGKSSTVNSLLNERAANVLAFQQDAAKPTAFSRRTPEGFVLTLIDTPSMLDQDAVSDLVRGHNTSCMRGIRVVPRGLSPVYCPPPVSAHKLMPLPLLHPFLPAAAAPGGHWPRRTRPRRGRCPVPGPPGLVRCGRPGPRRDLRHHARAGPTGVVQRRHLPDARLRERRARGRGV